MGSSSSMGSSSMGSMGVYGCIIGFCVPCAPCFYKFLIFIFLKSEGRSLPVPSERSVKPAKSMTGHRYHGNRMVLESSLRHLFAYSLSGLDLKLVVRRTSF